MRAEERAKALKELDEKIAKKRNVLQVLIANKFTTKSINKVEDALDVLIAKKKAL